LFTERQLLWHHGITTALETVTGVFIATLIGLILALILEMSSLLKRLLYPYLIISQTVPIISVAPLLILWLGYGIQAKIVIVALVCFFPITLSLLNGFRTVDTNQIKRLKTMGASNWQIFRKVKFPATMPFLFSGLKLSATYSVMAAIIGEWLGAMRGLGIYMTRSSHSFLTMNVFAAILLIVFLSFAFYLVIVLLERFCIPWHYEKTDEFYEN
jgi:ABC-type nitrate/sulfonate/bicarbonate transport system permease component